MRVRELNFSHPTRNGTGQQHSVHARTTTGGYTARREQRSYQANKLVNFAAKKVPSYGRDWFQTRCERDVEVGVSRAERC